MRFATNYRQELSIPQTSRSFGSKSLFFCFFLEFLIYLQFWPSSRCLDCTVDTFYGNHSKQRRVSILVLVQIALRAAFSINYLLNFNNRCGSGSFGEP